VKVHKLLKQVLLKNNVKFVELNGTIPVKHRGELISKFENDPDCKVFLSTEAGGSGLNLQVADILINFELPWNPAKKNQRIGRIDRLGQKSKNLTIYNFISRDSIEEQIAAGLIVKQSLFEGVLDGGSATNFVDFSSKGRGQFIEQLKELMDGFQASDDENEEIEEETPKKIPSNSSETEDNTQRELQPSISEKLEEEKQPETETSIEPSTQAEPQEGSPQSETPKKPAVDRQAPESQSEATPSKGKQYEQVLNSGLDFLSGLMKMSTGKDVGIEGKSVEVNEETGEVTMKFKMPKM
jgi:SNF2 family DNA or RNA helicase